MTLSSQMILHPAVQRKETVRKAKGKREKIPHPYNSLYSLYNEIQERTKAQIGKWLQMKGLLRVQRMTK